ncbi:6-N-acetylglucosamine synthase (BcsA) (PDB:4HG6) [Commensalibacter communis]|uniref:glycosyltransferase family 2 protein n=1 Tax=Commensalibacter communis TaxID=2972786 RepID=UPI0022FF50D8|nr:glycosyltransferase family 2 protein [Commensalibacter communis]CAI3959348.1 6-N-acetylglucosamine synthase (BcsA) (PDB:4HG6) [Commensalibacter communis]CAI3960358.1 6-N-acetylglucosamine synthase (BcsA) (PDB:4HG6) [Commensalibacter communis]
MKKWSILLPYYNEKNFLPGTLESICSQHFKDFTLILINNACDDQSEDIAKKTLAAYPDIDVVYLYEAQPGKTLALQTGLKAVNTPYVATIDADTYYPPYYLWFCNHIFEQDPEIVGVMACDIYAPYYDYQSQKRCRKIVRKSKIFSKQCHAGGYAQTFRTESLRQVGGFDQNIWPYVLMDHEVIHRLLKVGKTYYSAKHWCMPSERRADRKKVQWNKLEKMLYEFTPFFLKDWFFYSYLRKKFQARKANITQLREHLWEKNDG